MLKEKKIQLDNLKLNYIKGPDNGPPVLLLHGLTDRWQTFSMLIPYLLPYYTIYAADLRGHGKSDRAESYILDDYSDDIIYFINNIIKLPVSIIGHSLGGSIAVKTASIINKKIKSVILIDPFIFKDHLKDRAFQIYFKHCLNVISKYSTKKEIYEKILEKGVKGKKRTEDLYNTDAKTVKSVLDGAVFDNFHLAETLEKIICPVLVFRGNIKLQAHITKEKAEFLESGLQDCIVEYMDKSTHCIHEDQPVHTAKNILSFLNSI